MGFGIGVGPSWARVRVSTRGVGVSAGPRITRMHVSNRGVGLSSGIGPFSAWTHARYPRINLIAVGGSAGTRYYAEAYDPHGVEMASVAGLDAAALAPTGSGDLVAQLNDADRFPKWTLTLAFAALVWLVGISNLLNGVGVGGVTLGCVGVLSTVLTVFLYRKESIVHLVPVEYELQGPIPAWVGRMDRVWSNLSQLRGSWRIIESGRVETLHQHKINAGASHLINRVGASFSTLRPKVLVTNISVPSLKSADTSLYFLPDRVLVRTGRKWSDVGYQHLRVGAQHQRFIEEGAVPGDAKQVGTTWKFVNKKGGPDRRFKDNRQLPVMLYGRVTLSSSQGFSWTLDLSVMEVADSLASILKAHPA